MKFLILILAVTISQAQLFNDLPQQRFRQKSSRIIDEIVETIENELSKLITNELNPDDIKLIQQLSNTFAKVIYEEIQAAIQLVEDIETESREFTERMYAHLNAAA
ncbi:hypothetical protein P5E99_15945, partial [Clostridium perfringens]|nr:hypothetical protein [Clostridium perfringens]